MPCTLIRKFCGRTSADAVAKVTMADCLLGSTVSRFVDMTELRPGEYSGSTITGFPCAWVLQ